MPAKERIHPDTTPTEHSDLMINEPSSADVICGRGKAFNHVGNRRLRVLVALKSDAYMSISNRVHKKQIVDRLIDQVHESGGRFVKYCIGSQKYEQVPRAAAQKKVAHALRDIKAERTRPKLRKKKSGSSIEMVQEKKTIFSASSDSRTCEAEDKFSKLVSWLSCLRRPVDEETTCSKTSTDTTFDPIELDSPDFGQLFLSNTEGSGDYNLDHLDDIDIFDQGTQDTLDSFCSTATMV